MRGRLRPAEATDGSPAEDLGSWVSVFLFFSNNLGCAGSLLVSAVVTLVLLLLFGVIELG